MKRRFCWQPAGLLAGLALLVGVLLVPSAARANPTFYTSPLFGISAAPGGHLLVADSGQGIVDADNGSLVASLANVADVAPIAGTSDLWAIVSGDVGDQLLYRVHNGAASPVANLYDYEAKHNPHPASIDSNPFDVVDLGGGEALIADAAGNDLLKVDKHGKVKLVAVFPDQLVSTANIKSLVGCPSGPPDICGLPAMIPAEPVATSVAVGPDGAYYVGELKGFPAPTGASKVWRVAPNARNAKCGKSPLCKVALDGFTSIIDLAFGPDGRLNVAQLDDASWAAIEITDGVGALGGSVHACNLATKACQTVVSGIPILTSIAFRGDNSLWGATWSLVPGQADVVQLAP
jgi:hypothetical protein